MAHLATHMTLDVLIATVADLEARVIELKRAANTLASTYSLELPYMDVGVFASPALRRIEDSDAGSDAQD